MFITATRYIRSGELITRAFQSKYSNVDLMEKFGHIVKNNHNKIKIKMGYAMLRKDPLLDAKFEALS